MKRRLLIPTLLIGLATAAAPATANAAECPDADLEPAATTIPRVAASTLCLLNAERADAGLKPLKQNTRLARAATQHSVDMVGQSYFSHTGMDGRDATARIKATGYLKPRRAWTVGENLAWGVGDLATPRTIVDAWMASPGHRANILRARYAEIGLGIVNGNPVTADGQGATYGTTFGWVSQPQIARKSARARAANGKNRSRVG